MGAIGLAKCTRASSGRVDQGTERRVGDCTFQWIMPFEAADTHSRVGKTTRGGHMGDCNFCGQPAGFLRHQHKECLQRHDDGTRKILSLMSLGSTVPATTLVEQINEIADHSFIDEGERRNLEVQGWSNAVEGALSNNILDEACEKQLAEWKDKFSFSPAELESNESYTHLTKSVVIRELLSGVIPKHFAFKEAPPFNLQKGELVVWGFYPVGYFEERAGRLCLDRFRRWISGASAGFRCGVPFSGWHAGRA